MPNDNHRHLPLGQWLAWYAVWTASIGFSLSVLYWLYRGVRMLGQLILMWTQ